MDRGTKGQTKKLLVEFKKYHLNEWPSINPPLELTERLEEFEDVRRTLKPKLCLSLPFENKKLDHQLSSLISEDLKITTRELKISNLKDNTLRLIRVTILKEANIESVSIVILLTI
ncbi:hypothetical protein NPIL_701791 [Nephila pilipes]|uniref:Uncharacterized protein n=1 Tax=Nephila pilipes TaxID=299642 RepID=A0A8X6T9S9_NEPPI|nr:hypothetical protein NPIL_701791 [Nephila pilipes]